MISIVVPIYNGENYIEDCVKSILVQTYPEWELLLIDNASEDDTLDVCKEFASKDDRIQVIHQYRNMGVSVARNLGIEKARGEFITFIDVDDWVEEDYLERLLRIQMKKNADVVVCEYNKVYDKDRTVFEEQIQNKVDFVRKSHGKHKDEQKGTEKKKCQTKSYNTKEYLEKYFLRGNTHCWGVLFDREILFGVYFPKGITIGEDMLFLLEAAENAKTIVVTNYKGYNYYINEIGAMNKKFTPSYMDQITCWEKALEKISAGYPGLINRVESILVVSILLVVGKLSELDDEKRKEYIEEEKRCYEIFKKYGEKKEIQEFLPKGYKIKVLIYRYFPQIYLFLYGRLKKR